MSRATAVEIVSTPADEACALWPVLRAARPDRALTAETVARVVLRDPAFCADLTLRARLDGRTVGCALGALRHPVDAATVRGAPAAPRGFVKDLVVVPPARREGIATRLLEAIEARLAGLGATTIEFDGAAPAYFRPGLERANATARAFLGRRGYRETEGRLSLEADLGRLDLATGAAEGELAAAGFQVRRAAGDDLEFLRCQIAAAFPVHWAHEAELALSLARPMLHVALFAGRLAAFAGGGVCGPDVFGPMGTVAAFRRRGLGAVLLKRTLADIRAAGYGQALIGWVGPVPFYESYLGPLRPVPYVCLRKTLAVPPESAACRRSD